MSQTDDLTETKDANDDNTGTPFSGLKANLTEGQSWTRFLDIELPAEHVKSAFESVLAEYRKRAKIPGFRPGKAPIGMIRQRFADDIKQDALESLVPKAFEQALIQENLIPLNPPKLTNVEFEEGKPLKFKAEFEIRPTVKLGKYTGFRIEKKTPEVTDKDVDESLNYIRERTAEYIPVQRPAENGDMVIADLIKKHDKLERLKEEKLENVEIELGSQGILDEFQRGLLGMRIGEMKDISVKYPENYHDPNLAGDQILFLVVVKEIKKKVLAELNDEFAVKTGVAKNLAELRENARKGLERQAQEDATRMLRNEVIKRVIDANPFDVPISLLNSYLDRVVEDFKERGERFDEAAARSQYRTLGENLIRWSYLHFEIAKAENIKVEAEDRRKWVENFARAYNMSMEAAREALGKSKKIQEIDDSILEEKVLEFIINNSEIVTTK